jgi:hypothetical protein
LWWRDAITLLQLVVKNLCKVRDIGAFPLHYRRQLLSRGRLDNYVGIAFIA